MDAWDTLGPGHTVENRTFIDEVTVIEPGHYFDIEQQLIAPSDVKAYGKRILELRLILSVPNFEIHGTSPSHSIIQYTMPIQISENYQFRKESEFLLVINTEVTGDYINSIIAFIRNVLHLDVDIYNVSLNGSFVDPELASNVLHLYEGKSIIIFGNQYPFFGAGTRSIFDILDPWTVSWLSRHGTSFLFLTDVKSKVFRKWHSMLPFIAPSNSEVSTPDAANLDELISELGPRRQQPVDLELVDSYHQFLSKRSYWNFFSTPDRILMRKAGNTATRLYKVYPLRRFMVSPVAISDATKRIDTFVVFEGLPLSANIFASSGRQRSGFLSYLDQYLIVSILTFDKQIQLLWSVLLPFLREKKAGNWKPLSSHMPKDTVRLNISME
jgi:hypothetical protein